MTAWHQVYTAKPVRREAFLETLQRQIVTSDDGRPTLTQSLTRLRHLELSLFVSDDWEELSWLLNEVRHFHAKRATKHRLLKLGPRRLLQRRLQHFAGRATIKIVSLADTIEPRFEALRRRSEETGAAGRPRSRALGRIPAWASQPHHSAFAPSVRDCAELLLASAPGLDALVGAARALDPDRDHAGLEECLAHLHWHLRELTRHPPSTLPEFWQDLNGSTTESDRLLTVALEQANRVLQELRKLYLVLDSRLPPLFEVALPR